MLSVEGGPQITSVDTLVTSGRGLNPEELTSLLLPRLVSIDPASQGEDRKKAEDQRTRIEYMLLKYFRIAQRSQNTTIWNELMKSGHESAAEIVRSL
jgi:hypothetical protein